MSGGQGPSDRTRIYTRTGDAGQTGLLGPRRVSKDDPRVEAYGSVDELNAWLGWARASCEAWPALKQELEGILVRLQELLFVAGAELATDPAVGSTDRLLRITRQDVEQVERWIDAAEAALVPLRHFILPGGSPAAAALHVARTVARRAERRLVTLAAREGVRPELLAFFNRVSDLLFVLARRANALAGRADVLWEPSRPPSG